MSAVMWSYAKPVQRHICAHTYTRSLCILHIGLSTIYVHSILFHLSFIAFLFFLVLDYEKYIQDTNLYGVLDRNKYFVVRQIGHGACGKVKNIGMLCMRVSTACV